MKYKVKVVRNVPQETTVFINADSEDLAKEYAMHLVHEQSIKWSSWNFSFRYAEIEEIEEYDEICDQQEIASIEVFHEFVEHITLTKGVEA